MVASRRVLHSHNSTGLITMPELPTTLQRQVDTSLGESPSDAHLTAGDEYSGRAFPGFLKLVKRAEGTSSM